MAWTNTRARIASTKRRDPDADVTELQRQLRAERLEEHVREVLRGAPPLSDEQRRSIAAILRSNEAAA